MLLVCLLDKLKYISTGISCNFGPGESKKEFDLPFDSSKAKNIFGVTTVTSSDGNRVPEVQLYSIVGNKFILLHILENKIR